MRWRRTGDALPPDPHEGTQAREDARGASLLQPHAPLGLVALRAARRVLGPRPRLLGARCGLRGPRGAWGSPRGARAGAPPYPHPRSQRQCGHTIRAELPPGRVAAVVGAGGGAAAMVAPGGAWVSRPPPDLPPNPPEMRSVGVGV